VHPHTSTEKLTPDVNIPVSPPRTGVNTAFGAQGQGVGEAAVLKVGIGVAIFYCSVLGSGAMETQAHTYPTRKHVMLRAALHAALPDAQHGCTLHAAGCGLLMRKLAAKACEALLQHGNQRGLAVEDLLQASRVGIDVVVHHIVALHRCHAHRCRRHRPHAKRSTWGQTVVCLFCLFVCLRVSPGSPAAGGPPR